ncbi:MAG: RluA family pseudouridine synthase [Gammaproteobacteria bacterium]|nr:RluA family pseudouridine synthase [Gammaproteobacteria bacterium]
MTDSELTEASQNEAEVPLSSAGTRLDAMAAALFRDYSRSRLQRWIEAGYLTVNGESRKPRFKLLGGEQLELRLPPDIQLQSWEEALEDGSAKVQPTDLPVNYVHKDDDVFVINKPAGLVMHPAPGHRDDTLMKGVLYQYPMQQQLPRAGIVHRLDKDTSGLCVVAHSIRAHTSLVQQLQTRELGREYLAIVMGDPQQSGVIDEPIARHPKDRKRMAVVSGGKSARTHFVVLERFDGCALVSVKLETGRTHQIRVHMLHIGHPLLGDPVYGRATRTRRLSLPETAAQFSRQALHATRLSLVHPADNELMTYQCDMPSDMDLVLQVLRASA